MYAARRPPKVPLAPGPTEADNAHVGTVLARVVAWVREGYPAGVPEHDYVPLLALLRRRLSEQDVSDIARELMAAGVLPSDRIDIGALVLRVTDALPSPADVHRVRQRLRAKGWPTDLGPDDDDGDTDDTDDTGNTGYTDDNG